MSEVINLCYVIYPMLESIQEGKKLAEHVYMNREIIKRRQEEVTKPGYVITHGTKKQQEEIAAIEEAELRLRTDAINKYDEICNGLKEALDRQAYVFSDMLNSIAVNNLTTALDSGLVVYPYELAQLWKIYSDNTACRRMLGRYAASKKWDNVYIGDRYDSVKFVVDEYLKHLRGAIESPADSYGATWMRTPNALEKLAADQGVYEEFQVNLEELTDIPGQYKGAAEDAFLRNVLKRREYEYKL